MATPTEHTHHIKIRSTQMEIPSSGQTRRGDDDYDRKLQDAQQELERIQHQREELERKKLELEELTSRKRAFVSQQVELTEKLTSALTLIDRELFDMRIKASTDSVASPARINELRRTIARIITSAILFALAAGAWMHFANRNN